MSESVDLVLTPAERAFFEALGDLAVPYMIVGLGAALLEGASVTTQDIDVWFGPGARWDKVGEAARRAGGFYTSGLGLQRPAVGGPGLERVDLVFTAEGLGPFDEEHAGSREYLEATVAARRALEAERSGTRPERKRSVPGRPDDPGSGHGR